MEIPEVHSASIGAMGNVKMLQVAVFFRAEDEGDAAEVISYEVSHASYAA